MAFQSAIIDLTTDAAPFLANPALLSSTDDGLAGKSASDPIHLTAPSLLADQDRRGQGPPGQAWDEEDQRFGRLEFVDNRLQTRVSDESLLARFQKTAENPLAEKPVRATRPALTVEQQANNDRITAIEAAEARDRARGGVPVPRYPDIGEFLEQQYQHASRLVQSLHARCHPGCRLAHVGPWGYPFTVQGHLGRVNANRAVLLASWHEAIRLEDNRQVAAALQQAARVEVIRERREANQDQKRRTKEAAKKAEKTKSRKRKAAQAELPDGDMTATIELAVRTRPSKRSRPSPSPSPSPEPVPRTLSTAAPALVPTPVPQAVVRPGGLVLPGHIVVPPVAEAAVERREEAAVVINSIESASDDNVLGVALARALEEEFGTNGEDPEISDEERQINALFEDEDQDDVVEMATPSPVAAESSDPVEESELAYHFDFFDDEDDEDVEDVESDESMELGRALEEELARATAEDEESLAHWNSETSEDRSGSSSPFEEHNEDDVEAISTAAPEDQYCAVYDDKSEESEEE